MEDNEKILNTIMKYLSYLEDNFEIAQSYLDMISKANKANNTKENKLKLDFIQKLLECLRQKLFNKNEITYNINTIKDNYECIITNYLNWCNIELNNIFNYLENDFKLKPIRF